MITVAVNPKEYFEKYRNKNMNKKHKGIRECEVGMRFDAYASQIMSLQDMKQLVRIRRKKFRDNSRSKMAL